MIEIDFQNLRKVKPEDGISDSEFDKESGKIPEFLEKFAARGQGFTEILDDSGNYKFSENLEKINKFAADCEGKFEDVVVLGIGGSALGTMCLQQSLKHLFENEKANLSKKNKTSKTLGSKNSKFPKLHVLDNIDPDLISELEEIIDYSKTLFIVVTKSGGTPETLAEYFYFRNKFEEKFNKNLEDLNDSKTIKNSKGLKILEKVREHFVFITDPEKGLLQEIAKAENISYFEIPENVGGRFSVLTAVGLLPAKLIGIEIEKLIEGAKKMKDDFLTTSKNLKTKNTNLAFKLASAQFLLNKKGKTINVMMPYSQRLIRFADWYRQLLAESIGKKFNNKKEEVFVGITPINALGVTDQHSQSQLYNEGPNDKFFIFIEVENFDSEIQIPSNLPENLNYLKNLTFNKLLKTEKQATEQSLTQNNRPNITIKIPKINEETLGALFLLFEATTAFLGEFFEINAFDQPGVELSKQLTKKLLS